MDIKWWGNAVPVELARIIALSIKHHLEVKTNATSSISNIKKVVGI